MVDSINILVIDDSEDDRLLYKRVLKKNTSASYSVTEADNGDDGLLSMNSNPPACVLLDYSLPGRNGVEVLKRIRSAHPFVPVVMLTGQGNEAVAVTAIQEGAQNYISKANITPESLQRVIHVAIEHCALQHRIHEQRTSLEIFTHALAHDLKEPVRTIRSFLDLITLHEKTLSERGKGYFGYIQKAAERMSALIDTVYFYTRLNGPEQQPSKESCDVSKILEDVKDNISELIREHKAIITCDALPQVQANRMQLIQVLQNLLTNAINHTNVTPAIHISAKEKGGDWLFSVNDNGPGIDKEHHDKIFEPFKRFVRHEKPGLGLGLAICKKIVESHGGKIWYESRPEVGTTFLFTLPNASTMTAGMSVASPSRIIPVKEDGQLGTLLLVEDNEADVELARIMLIEEAGLKCNLLVARDGHEALDRLHERVDLMLLDINMPGMDGFEVIRQMRTQEALRQIPVIMCTTSTYDKDMERAKSLGAIGYLTKPAELHRLKSIIDKIATIKLCSEGTGYALLRSA